MFRLRLLQFISWASGDRIDLKANESYWGNVPAIKNVVWRVIPEVATRSIEVEAGSVDIALDIQATELERLESNEDVKIFRHEASSINFMCFNTQIEPFNNVKVRQAINMAIDKEAIYQVVYQNTGKIAQAPMSSVVWGFNDQLEQTPYDVEAAKALLAEAGYPNGFTMTITCDQDQKRLDTAEMIQAQLAQIGITVEVAPMERGAFIDKVIEGSLQMFGLGWSSDTGDPDYALFASFHSSMHGAGGNMSFYTNEKVDELLEKGRTSTDPEVRKEAYMEAQEIIWEEVPCIFLQCPEDLYAYSARVQNFGVYYNGELRIPEFSFAE